MDAEIQICLDCQLPDCMGLRHPKCGLRAIRKHKYSNTPFSRSRLFSAIANDLGYLSPSDAASALYRQGHTPRELLLLFGCREATLRKWLREGGFMERLVFSDGKSDDLQQAEQSDARSIRKAGAAVQGKPGHMAVPGFGNRRAKDYEPVPTHAG